MHAAQPEVLGWDYQQEITIDNDWNINDDADDAYGWQNVGKLDASQAIENADSYSMHT